MGDAVMYINGVFTGIVVAMSIMSVSDTMRARKKLEQLQEETAQALELHKKISQVAEKTSKAIFDKVTKDD